MAEEPATRSPEPGPVRPVSTIVAGAISPERIAGGLAAVVLITATLLLADGLPPGAHDRSPTPSPAPVTPIPSAASPTALASPAALADLRALATIDGAMLALAPELEGLVAATPPSGADIATVLRRINAYLVSGRPFIATIRTDPALADLADDLQASYEAISEQTKAALAIGLSDAAGYVAAGRHVLDALAGLQPVDGRLRAAILVRPSP